MKDAVLGKKYTLSVAVVDEKKIKSVNLIYRNKNEATDILSFPLDEKEGEIFLNLKQTKIQAKTFERKYENFLAFLFIHGLVHLKGFAHGSRMESEEAKYRKKFGV